MRTTIDLSSELLTSGNFGMYSMGQKKPILNLYQDSRTLLYLFHRKVFARQYFL